MEKMLFEMNIAFTYEEIDNFLQTKKNKMSKISDLRSLWIEDNNIYSYPIKIISEYFLRKHCPSWIFNSRI